MKRRIEYIIQIVLFLGLLLPMAACSRRQSTTNAQIASPPSVDDVYNQSDIDDQLPPDDVSYQVFYDDLSPYGNWVDYPAYGYVWIPRIFGEFHPYATQGHWVMTNYGWTWVSDYRWGWAAFHYGRWAYETQFGWMWIPGRVWGPAWVSWRENDDYFGWAPLGPYGNRYATMGHPHDHYRFVPRRYFTDRYVYNHCADWHNNVTIINYTTVINETHIVNKNKYYYGPRKDFVEKAVGQKVREAKIENNPKPNADAADNDRVKVYRPRLETLPKDKPKPSPRNVTQTTDLQPIPAEKRLTPTPRTEGGLNTPPVKQPRRNEAPQPKPDVKQSEPTEPRPQVITPRRNEAPTQPNVKQPVPKTEPRPEVKQPRRNEAPKAQPIKTQPTKKERGDVRPIKEKKAEVPKRKEGNK